MEEKDVFGSRLFAFVCDECSPLDNAAETAVLAAQDGLEVGMRVVEMEDGEGLVKSLGSGRTDGAEDEDHEKCARDRKDYR